MSFNHFCKKFKAEVGMEFKEWKKGKRVESSNVITFEDEQYRVEASADDPYWTLYKK